MPKTKDIFSAFTPQAMGVQFTGKYANDDRNRFEGSDPHPARIKEDIAEATRMMEDADQQVGHILLLICQPRLQWQQVVAFIRPLRADYLPFFQNIIVLGPEFPPKPLWDLFPDVAFLVGQPAKRDDLQSAGVHRADKVVLLAGPPNIDVEARLADSNAMIVNSMLEAIFEQSGVDRFALFEYTYAANSQILPQVPVCSADTQKLRAENPSIAIPAAASSISQPRYASGRIFTPSLFGALFAQAYTTPGIMELTEALVMPSRRRQETYPYLIPPLERVAPEWIGRTYDELFSDLVENGLGVQVQEPPEPVQHAHVLPIGLYRRAKEANLGEPEISPPIQPVGAAHQGVSFVYANPSLDSGPVTLLPGDCVYVLAPKEWGRRVCIIAERCMTDNDMSWYGKSIFEELRSGQFSSTSGSPFDYSWYTSADVEVGPDGLEMLQYRDGFARMCGGFQQSE
jgi:hypothetical protein